MDFDWIAILVLGVAVAIVAGDRYFGRGKVAQAAEGGIDLWYDARNVAEGIEHLWETNQVDRNSRLDMAIESLSELHPALEHDTLRVAVEYAVRQLKRGKQQD